ncbi:MAG TPA: Mur ligase family protein, partial [Microbacteriaceae bacterium]|nr:Mur ligase family protein [Microbacteriaceae bacterium]
MSATGPARGEASAEADAIYAELLLRLGEGAPERRLHATRKAVELLGDPHRAYPIIHVTGTNGKTSTSRMIEALLRAHNLTTGLFTSPHLARFTERIVIGGRPISDADLVRNWNDVAPYIAMTDRELHEAGEQRLTFFEAMTVLGFACFADAAVDVAVIEVGMGGEWDSTNVGDGQVAVITPISLDHMAMLGNTVAEIAHTKSGIIKPGSRVVSSAQPEPALQEIRLAARRLDVPLAVQGEDFDVTADA